MISIDDLRTALTSDQVEKSALAILESLGFPVASWQKGSVIGTIVKLFSRVIAPFTDFQVTIASSGFLDWAEGDWLTVVAEQVYGVTREPATFATGFIEMDNSAGGDFTPAAGEVRYYNPTTKKTYRNSASFHLAPLQTNLSVAVEAIDEGSASTSAPNTVTALESTLIGVTVTNPAAIVGFDAESDVSLRERCRLKLASLSPNGPKDAYDYVARTQELNGGVNITRTNGVYDSNLGLVTLYIAGPSGSVSSGDRDMVDDAVTKLVTPTGFDCTVLSAVNVPVNVTCVVSVYASQNLLNADVQAAVASRLTEYFPTVPIGGDYTVPGFGFLYKSALEHEIRSAKTLSGVDGVQIHHVTVSSPASDIAAGEDEVFTLGTVTTTVIQVP